MQRIKQWFEIGQQRWFELEVREQQLLGVAAVVFLMMVIHFGIIKPLHDGLDRAEQKVRSKRNELNYVKQAASQLLSLKGQSSDAASSGLSSVVSRSAMDKGLVITRIQPQGQRLLVQLENVDFNELIGWLGYLVQTQRIVVDALEVRRTDMNGMVAVQRLQLSR